MWAGRGWRRPCPSGHVPRALRTKATPCWSCELLELRRQVSPSPARERAEGERRRGLGLSASLEGGDPEAAALPPGGRRVTAWLKDGELGKQSFQRSQGLGGAEGALRSGRRMSPVGQVCLSPRAGPGKSPSEGSGPPLSAAVAGTGGEWGHSCSQAPSSSRENVGQTRRRVRASLAGEL